MRLASGVVSGFAGGIWTAIVTDLTPRQHSNSGRNIETNSRGKLREMTVCRGQPKRSR